MKVQKHGLMKVMGWLGFALENQTAIKIVFIKRIKVNDGAIVRYLSYL